MLKNQPKIPLSDNIFNQIIEDVSEHIYEYPFRILPRIKNDVIIFLLQVFNVYEDDVQNLRNTLLNNISETVWSDDITLLPDVKTILETEMKYGEMLR
ncbi:MAG: hypothetical protein RR144_04635 [Clostridia bacterium]